MDKDVFKPKMRITLLSDKGVPQSDRLVDSYTELNMGPKEHHAGPIRLEITLTNSGEVDKFKAYLDRLSGRLPIKTTGTRGRPSLGEQPIDEPREEILTDINKMVQEGKTQKDIIKYLRGLGFIFMLTEDFLQYFPDFGFNTRDVGQPSDTKQYPKSLSWMVRQIKKAKDPKSDKYDPQLIFGFSILEGPSRKVVPYLYKERQHPLKTQPRARTLSFSSVGFTKYPTYMQEDERLKFSAEIRQLLNSPDKKPTKFFLRWAPDVTLPTDTYNSLQRLGIKFKNDK